MKKEEYIVPVTILQMYQIIIATETSRKKGPEAGMAQTTGCKYRKENVLYQYKGIYWITQKIKYNMRIYPRTISECLKANYSISFKTLVSYSTTVVQKKISKFKYNQIQKFTCVTWSPFLLESHF